MEGTEERVSELKDRTIKITQSEQQNENRLEELNGASYLWNYNKRSNICAIRLLEREEKGCV